MTSKGLKMTLRNTRDFPAKGFTLVELMLVVATLAVLKVISFPIFQNASTSYQITSAVLP
jgi:prepilin-type N-terminal cleavage/methylation domain-containing protein